MHFPSCTGIFVHTWVWTPEAFPFWIYPLSSCPDRLAIPQDPLLCPQDAAASAPALGPPAPLPGLCSRSSLCLVAWHLYHRETASPLFCRLSLFCYLWISYQQLIPDKFQIVTPSLFQWLLCNSNQTLYTLVSDLYQHPSTIKTHQLWGKLATLGHVPSLSLCLLSSTSVPDTDWRH